MPKRLVKTDREIKTMINRERKALNQKEKRMLKQAARVRKAEKFYKKTGRWPRWFK
jgi:hypothetical protein